jgi:Lar family restriction alleviation protein
MGKWDVITNGEPWKKPTAATGKDKTMPDIYADVRALAPCPFCGGTDLQIKVGTILGRNVYCMTCGGAGAHAEVEAHAIESWNRRHAPAPDALEERLNKTIHLASLIKDARLFAFKVLGMGDQKVEYKEWQGQVREEVQNEAKKLIERFNVVISSDGKVDPAHIGRGTFDKEVADFIAENAPAPDASRLEAVKEYLDSIGIAADTELIAARICALDPSPSGATEEIGRLMNKNDSLAKELMAKSAPSGDGGIDGWREVVHIVENIRKGHPYLDAMEVLCSAIEESKKWAQRSAALSATSATASDGLREAFQKLVDACEAARVDNRRIEWIYADILHARAALRGTTDVTLRELRGIVPRLSAETKYDHIEDEMARTEPPDASPPQRNRYVCKGCGATIPEHSVMHNQGRREHKGESRDVHGVHYYWCGPVEPAAKGQPTDGRKP